MIKNTAKPQPAPPGAGCAKKVGFFRLAMQATVYALPLVVTLRQIQVFTTTGLHGIPKTPWNTVAHSRSPAGPEKDFVCINNDTLYSGAPIDLGPGPLLLRMPNTGGRYFVAQFLDAYSNNFAYIGSRSPGLNWLLVPPGWQGQAPAGTQVLAFPTRIGVLIIRWAYSKKDELPAVHALQNAVQLLPQQAAPLPAGLLQAQKCKGEALQFFEEARVYMHAFPPAPRFDETVQSFAPLGLCQSGQTPYKNLPLLRGLLLQCAFYSAKRLVLRRAASPKHICIKNNWQLAYHAFDYNMDFFGPGTINSPQWVMASGQRAAFTRAACALSGLWGNHGYESAYALAWKDSAARQLNGKHRYCVTFKTPPPAKAFWSLSLYDVPGFRLVENEIGRYSVGDRTPGLVYTESGHLKIYICAKKPQQAQALANWLPAPKGPFRLILRMYQPKLAELEEYIIEGVERL